MASSAADPSPPRPAGVPAEYTDCGICHKIWLGLTHPDVSYIRIGSPQQALSVGCTRHVPLIQFVLERKGIGSGSTDERISVWAINRKRVLGFRKGCSRESFTTWCVLVNRHPINHVGIGRILDPDWADLTTVTQHKDKCLATHSDTCENPNKIWSTTPAWLIDTARRCMVPGNVTNRFVALSYMYGTGIVESYVKVDATLVKKLQEPHALDASAISPSIHPVVSRAMHLAVMLGERYLWADALCILQGSGAGTAEQLNLMGAIYANALFTIIAADGNAETALSGLKGISPSRILRQHVIPFGQENVVTRDADPLSINPQLPYHFRGWTYQEYAMSPRRIIFSDKLVHWECQCSFWGEGLTTSSRPTQRLSSNLRNIFAGFPDIKELDHVFSEYNRRKFTYDEDTLPGIHGLLSILSRTFVGGFLCGLPEMLFVRSLGWMPSQKNPKELRRRTSSDRPSTSRLTPSALPSWSWAGWQGSIGNPGLEAGLINQNELIVETIPITEWFTGSTPDGSNRRRIRSTWYENRSSFKDSSRPLPSGWTRHSIPSLNGNLKKPHLHPDGYNEFVFKHERFPSRPNEGYWYFPFPVPEITSSTPPSMSEQTPYLFCRTKRAWVLTNQDVIADSPLTLLIAIRDNSDHIIGILTLHNKDQLQDFPRGRQRKSIEVVAIYRSREHRRTSSPALTQNGEGTITNVDKYAFLWVEWENGVAYRKASGWVYQGDWEKLCLEEISLVLG